MKSSRKARWEKEKHKISLRSPFFYQTRMITTATDGQNEISIETSSGKKVFTSAEKHYFFWLFLYIRFGPFVFQNDDMFRINSFFFSCSWIRKLIRIHILLNWIEFKEFTYVRKRQKRKKKKDFNETKLKQKPFVLALITKQKHYYVHIYWKPLI